MKRIALAVSLFVASFGGNAVAADIVDTAVAAGSFTTLVKAVQAAGLKDPAKLKAVLTYHVVPGKVMAADVVKIKSAKTVQGSSAKVTVMGGNVMIDKAHVIKTDIETDNGVIHVIDSVILPKM